MILFRPTGLAELKLVRDSGWRAWPPRLPDQPIFYPVTTFEYAEKIARDWNAIGSEPNNVGFVMQFEVTEAIAGKYPVELAGGRDHAELWIPAEELDDLNTNIVGTIEVIAAYKAKAPLALEDAKKLWADP